MPVRHICKLVILPSFHRYYRRFGFMGHMIIRLLFHDVKDFAVYFMIILLGFGGGLLLALKGDSNLDVHEETR